METKIIADLYTVRFREKGLLGLIETHNGLMMMYKHPGYFFLSLGRSPVAYISLGTECTKQSQPWGIFRIAVEHYKDMGLSYDLLNAYLLYCYQQGRERVDVFSILNPIVAKMIVTHYQGVPHEKPADFLVYLGNRKEKGPIPYMVEHERAGRFIHKALPHAGKYLKQVETMPHNAVKAYIGTTYQINLFLCRERFNNILSRMDILPPIG